jgi:hypothetical protein
MANPSANLVVPPPPRLTGDWQSDYIAVSNWMSDFYFAQTTPPPLFDPSALPDPTNTTAGLAQQTANIAWKYIDLLNKSLPTFPVTPPTS